MTNKTIILKILRFNPEHDEKPFYKDFVIPYKKNWSILDALGYIKDELDTSLSYRWSCRMAVCGSCGFMINGTPKLGCETFIRDFKQRTITIEPLANFAIERDLIVNVDEFITKLESVKPYITAAKKQTDHLEVNKQTPQQMGLYKQFSMCINCMLCYSACPQVGLNPLFTGPAAIALGHRYNLDSRDEGNAQRTEVIQGKNGVWSCTFVGYCSTVCPAKVDPAAAINQNKLEGTKDWALSLLSPYKGELH